MWLVSSSHSMVNKLSPSAWWRGASWFGFVPVTHGVTPSWTPIRAFSHCVVSCRGMEAAGVYVRRGRGLDLCLLGLLITSVTNPTEAPETGSLWWLGAQEPALILTGLQTSPSPCNYNYPPRPVTLTHTWPPHLRITTHLRPWLQAARLLRDAMHNVVLPWALPPAPPPPRSLLNQPVKDIREELLFLRW